MSGKPAITPLDKIVGANVQKLREAKGMSQEKLAEHLGCSDGYVSLLETGKRAWKNLWIWRATKVFNVSAAELFGGINIDPQDKPLFEAIKTRINLHEQEAIIKSEISLSKKSSDRKKPH